MNATLPSPTTPSLRPTCCWLEASLNFNPCGAVPSAVVQGTQDYYCRRHVERMAAAGCVLVEVGEDGRDGRDGREATP